MSQNIIALIPARGGSKRVPRKNLKELAGKPLIAHSIEVALKSPLLSRVIVSTDDQEIATVAQKYGAEVPFMRPPAAAQDSSSDKDVLVHLLNWLTTNNQHHPDYIVYLRPTTPFKTAAMIEQAVDVFKNNPDLSGVRTVTKSEGVFNPYWMYKPEGEILVPFVEGVDISKYYQSQLLPLCYRLNGVVDVLKPEVILNQPRIFGDQIGFVEIDEYFAVDIDTEREFALCEFYLTQGLVRLG